MFFFAFILFRRDYILYPSTVFYFMWGMNCIFNFLILKDYVTPLTEKSTFDYQYMETYIIYFTIASIIGFSIAHIIFRTRYIQNNITLDFIDTLLYKYKWIMWLNFIGGILRIYIMINLVGLDFSNIMDYRLAANDMMMSVHEGFAGIFFRITAYINMLAIIYVALSGLQAGIDQLSMKDTLKIFVLYSPIQLATGGRLFILYFVIFYFGCFLLGRGISMQTEERKWIMQEEISTIFNMLIIMLPLVVVISLSRGEGGINNISKSESSFLDHFSYISDGTMTTEQSMQFFSGGNYLIPAGGSTILTGTSEPALEFREYKHRTTFGSSVYSIIYPLFLDFGYKGSIIAWAILAFLLESIALKCLSNLSLLRFFIYAFLLKMCYESILTNPIASNIPYFELLILFAVLNKHLFRKHEYSDE